MKKKIKMGYCRYCESYVETKWNRCRLCRAMCIKVKKEKFFKKDKLG
jgi:hypothetical protein